MPLLKLLPHIAGIILLLMYWIKTHQLKDLARNCCFGVMPYSRCCPIKLAYIAESECKNTLNQSLKWLCSKSTYHHGDDPKAIVFTMDFSLGKKQCNNCIFINVYSHWRNVICSKSVRDPFPSTHGYPPTLPIIPATPAANAFIVGLHSLPPFFINMDLTHAR